MRGLKRWLACAPAEERPVLLAWVRTLENTPDLPAELARRALASWKTQWQTAYGDAGSVLRERYAFSPAVLDALLAALAPITFDAAPCPAVSLDAYAFALDLLAPADSRRADGLFLTPPPLVAALAEALLPEPVERFALYEAGIGTGALGLAAFRRWRTCWPIEPALRAERLAAFLERSWLIEHDPNLARLASLQWLIALYDEPALGVRPLRAWPIRHGDALATPPEARFTHAIGNPPFLGEKRHRERVRAALESPWLRKVYRGKADYVTFFIWQSVGALEKGGRAALLTPSYWRTADSAVPLRHALDRSVNWRTLPAGPFFSAPGLDACLFIATRDTPRPAPPTPATPTTRLGDVFDILTGIQSGADSLSAAAKARFGLEQPLGTGIFVLSKEEANALEIRLSPPERELLVPLVKSPAIGPCLLDSGEPRYLLYLDGRTPLDALPNVATHLSPYRELLAARRECRLGRMPWWRLHWPRTRAVFTSESLLVPQRALEMRVAYAAHGAFTSVDVYHLMPRRPTPLFAWLAILHSRRVEAWLRDHGKRKGELLELYHTPLAALPIPAPDTPLDELESLGHRLYDAMRAARAQADPAVAWHRQAKVPACAAPWRDLLASIDACTEDAFKNCAP